MYDFAPKPSTLIGRVGSLEQNARHLTNRREEEFGLALVNIAAVEEGVPSTSVELVSVEPCTFTIERFLT